MNFEFDAAKSATNSDKHGIDFVQAQEIWATVGVEVALDFVSEPRWLRLGMWNGKLWAAVYTLRAGRIRLISVRRARDGERGLYEQETHER